MRNDSASSSSGSGESGDMGGGNSSKGGDGGGTGPGHGESTGGASGPGNGPLQMLPTRTLANIYNSCYINAVLQLLAVIPGFKAHLTTMRDAFSRVGVRCATTTASTVSASSTGASSSQLMASLCELLVSVLNKPVPTSTGPLILSNLRARFEAPFSGQLQQDAEEFLLYILDFLETSTGFRPFTAWLNLLQGSITGCIKCDNCNAETHALDPFTILKFPTASTKPVVSMQTLLEHNFKNERLIGDNRFECASSRCRHSKQNATKTSLFTSLCASCGLASHPPSLLVSFARFELNTYTGRRAKITTPVSFGHTLQLQRGALIYDLIGIIIHEGDTDASGHYYALLRFQKGKGDHSWFEVNDDAIREMADSDIDNICAGTHSPYATPYILAFQSRQEQGPSRPRCSC